MARTVNRAGLGAWLLKCNPAVWDLGALMASGDRRVTSWAVRPGYRSALMAEGDPVLFWVSGDGRLGFERGIWGLGRVVAEAEPWVESERGLWHRPGAQHAVRARVRVDIPLLPRPLTDDSLRAAGIDGLEVQRMPFAANPSWVPRTVLSRVTDLLPCRPPERPGPGAAQEEYGDGGSGSGQVPPSTRSTSSTTTTRSALGRGRR